MTQYHLCKTPFVFLSRNGINPTKGIDTHTTLLSYRDTDGRNGKSPSKGISQSKNEYEHDKWLQALKQAATYYVYK